MMAGNKTLSEKNNTYAFEKWQCVLLEQSFLKYYVFVDHGDRCDGQEATYCMNGGTCYKIPAMNTLSCV